MAAGAATKEAAGKPRGRDDPRAKWQEGFPHPTDESFQTVLDRIEASLKPELYLEIGSRTGGSLAQRKCSYIAIDPEFDLRTNVMNASPHQFFFQQKSDEFFASGFLEALGWRPGLAFIDGMHLFEFALRDFANCEARMAKTGVVCVHDVVPYNEAMTTRDPDYLAERMPWTGDVWKLMYALKKERPDLRLELLSAKKSGLGVIGDLDPDSGFVSRVDEVIERYRDITFGEIGGAMAYADLLGLKPPSELSWLAT